MHYDEDRNAYSLEQSGFKFSYKKTDFFVNGYASVVSIEDMYMYLDEDNTFRTKDMQITLFIWPMADKSEKYGIDFYMNTKEESIWLQVYVDENAQCLTEIENPEEKKYVEELLNKYKDRIKSLFGVANECWDLGL